MSERNFKTREGYDIWDKLCAIPKYGFVIGPSGGVVKVQDLSCWIDREEAQRVVDEAQSEVNLLREERDQLRAELAEYKEDPSYAAACETIRKLRAELEAIRGHEPAVWLACYFGGKQHGKIYGGPCDTKEEIDRYIQQVERSNDCITLVGKPFYDAPVHTPSHVELRLRNRLIRDVTNVPEAEHYMPKPWRNKVLEMAIAGALDCDCDRCGGQGETYSNGEDGTPNSCAYCSGTGYALPPQHPDAVSVPGVHEFAVEILRGALEGGDFDGGTIQEMGVKYGLLFPEQRTEPCCESGCNCAEFGFPAECFRIARALLSTRRAEEGQPCAK